MHLIKEQGVKQVSYSDKTDPRDSLFSSIANKRFEAEIYAERDGCISGVSAAMLKATEMGIGLDFLVEEGDQINKNQPFAKG